MNKLENTTKQKKEKPFGDMPEKAGVIQCLFIIIQSLVFPELGIIGAILAAQCALMPWFIPTVKKDPVTAFSMSISSALITPFFSMFCIAVFDAFLSL